MTENLYYLFVSGLILGSGPCLSFCAPILASYALIYKQSFGKATLSYIIFSVSKLASYIILGALCGLFSGILSSEKLIQYFDIINILLGLFVVFIGISILASKFLSVNNLCSKLHKGNIRNVGLLGFLVGFAPCLPLLGILNYIVIISKSVWQAVIFSLVFGLGTTISPLFLLIALSGKIGGNFFQFQKLHKIMRFISAGVLIFLGIQIILRILLR
jgi:sulfite exporter TauE/SafE